MPKFQYVAMDSRGKEQKGVLEVASQADAINRLKEMGFFPTKVMEAEKPKAKKDGKKAAPAAGGGKKKGGGINIKAGKIVAIYTLEDTTSNNLSFFKRSSGIESIGTTQPATNVFTPTFEIGRAHV